MQRFAARLTFKMDIYYFNDGNDLVANLFFPQLWDLVTKMRFKRRGGERKSQLSWKSAAPSFC